MMEHESWLEIGLVVVAIGLVTGLGMWVLANAAGSLRQRQRYDAPPPSAGSVPQERHEHTASVAAR